MRVLIACEFSGIVREAFRARGHDAWSCDLLPTEIPGQHIQGDVLGVLGKGWDLAIAHPTCTFLCNSGVKHLYVGGRRENGVDVQRWKNMRESAEFFLKLWSAPIAKIAIENPIMHRHARALIGERGPDQIIQPWMFGHPETKATCLWLKGLPLLKPTRDVRREMEGLRQSERSRVHYASPGPERWKERSRTLRGIAEAMAEQWGKESQ